MCACGRERYPVDFCESGFPGDRIAVGLRNPGGRGVEPMSAVFGLIGIPGPNRFGSVSAGYPGSDDHRVPLYISRGLSPVRDYSPVIRSGPVIPVRFPRSPDRFGKYIYYPRPEGLPMDSRLFFRGPLLSDTNVFQTDCHCHRVPEIPERNFFPVEVVMSNGVTDGQF